MHYKFAQQKYECVRFNTLYINENTGNIIILYIYYRYNNRVKIQKY